MKKALLLILIIATALFAQQMEQLKLNIGSMLVTNFETEVQYSNSNIPIGIVINTKDQLGMESDNAAFYLSGYYRFNHKHALGFSYYDIKSNGNILHLSKDIPWGNNTIKAGAKVDSYFNMGVYKLNYLYSFYHNDDIELQLSAGLHVTRVRTGLHAFGSIQDSNGTISTAEDYASNTSTTLPLPVVGFNGRYEILTQKLSVLYSSEFFVLKIGDYKGSFIQNSLGVEYRFMQNLAAGLAFNASEIYIETTKDDNKLKIQNNLGGFLLNLSYYY